MTRTRVLVLLLIVAASVITTRVLRAQGTPELLETQRIVMENVFARVIEVRVPAGVAEKLHSHGRGVTIALANYDNEARNTGSTEQHVIRVELK